MRGISRLRCLIFWLILTIGLTALVLVNRKPSNRSATGSMENDTPPPATMTPSAHASKPDSQPNVEPPVQFIVRLWEKLFGVLGLISVLGLIKYLPESTRDRWGAAIVEVWVLLNLLLAAGLALGILQPKQHIWLQLAVVYSAIRLAEMAIYHFNILMFDGNRALSRGTVYYLTSYRRSLLLSIHNYVEIIFWFSFIYSNLTGGFVGVEQPYGQMMWIELSFKTMSTFGASNLTPVSQIARVAVLAQSFIGLFMSLLIVSRFLSLIPIPRSMDRLESEQQQ